MIELLPCADHVVAARIQGVLTTEDYKRLVADVEAKLGRHERIGVLVDLVDFEDLTVGAALADIRYDLSKLLQLKRFPREAVVTDKQWIHAAVRVASPLIPHMDLRAFPRDAFPEAMAWVLAADEH